MGKRTKRGNVRYDKNPFIDMGLVVGMDTAIVLSELSKTSFAIYLSIREYSVRIDGKIILNIKDIKEYAGFSQKKSVYNGVSELIAKNILACSEEWDEFYYNPKYIGPEKEN